MKNKLLLIIFLGHNVFSGGNISTINNKGASYDLFDDSNTIQTIQNKESNIEILNYIPITYYAEQIHIFGEKIYDLEMKKCQLEQKNIYQKEEQDQTLAMKNLGLKPNDDQKKIQEIEEEINQHIVQIKKIINELSEILNKNKTKKIIQ